MVTKYKEENKKSGYYDIPGGKIEECESSEETAIREMKEETGVKVEDLKYKGNIIIEYPNRIFDFDVFITNKNKVEPQEFEENISEWIDIKELLQKEKILSNIMILDSFFIKGLIDDEIICFYSDNDPYVKSEAEKDFVDKISTEQILIPNARHINSERGYDTFEELVSYL